MRRNHQYLVKEKCVTPYRKHREGLSLPPSSSSRAASPADVLCAETCIALQSSAGEGSNRAEHFEEESC